MSLADEAPRADEQFVHRALIVDSDETLRQRLVPALDRALRAGETVLMVVSPHTQQVVHGALGDRAEQLHWGDTRAFYQRLGFAYETFRRYLQQQHAAGQRVYVVAEPDIPTSGPGAPVDQVAAYLSYEAMCNDAYAAYRCPVTCIWDSRRHPTLVIEGARSLHNYELAPTGPIPNPDFVPPAQYLAGCNHIAPEPPPPFTDVDTIVIDTHALAALREQLRQWTRDRDFAPSAIWDVVLATSEVATNGLIHGAPPVHIRGWHHADTLIVQVDDAGGIPIPPLAGYLPPAADQRGGRGLWLARQLADTLTTYTTSASTTVRMHFPHDFTHLQPITE